MLIGASAMSAPLTTDEQPRQEPVFHWFRSVIQGVPRDYTVKSFLRRMLDHVVIYGAILLASIFILFFLARPMETGFLTLAGAVVVGLIIETCYRRRRKWSLRLQHIAELGLAAS